MIFSTAQFIPRLWATSMVRRFMAWSTVGFPSSRLTSRSFRPELPAISDAHVLAALLQEEVKDLLAVHRAVLLGHLLGVELDGPDGKAAVLHSFHHTVFVPCRAIQALADLINCLVVA